MRALVDIPDRQIEELARISETKNLSRAEAIRQAISHYIESSKVDSASAFGIWKDRAIDGLTFQERSRSEWKRACSIQIS